MRKFLIALAFAFIAIVAGHADNYPSRPITLIVPFPPGGSTDVAARIMADKMGASLGQPVIVENVGGAGGSIGLGRLARATPDGYTIDIGQWDTHVGSIIYNISFDLRADFAPIGLISINPMLLVAKKTLPADDLKSLVAYMKAHPGDAKFVNQNASAQVGGLLLQKLTGTELLFVPYRGAGPAMTDLISGQVDLLLVQGAARLAASARRHHQGARRIVAGALGLDAGYPFCGRIRRGRAQHRRLVRFLCAEGHAGRCHRQAQCGDGGGAGRSGGEGA